MMWNFYLIEMRLDKEEIDNKILRKKNKKKRKENIP